MVYETNSRGPNWVYETIQCVKLFNGIFFIEFDEFCQYFDRSGFSSYLDSYRLIQIAFKSKCNRPDSVIWLVITRHVTCNIQSIYSLHLQV